MMNRFIKCLVIPLFIGLSVSSLADIKYYGKAGFNLSEDVGISEIQSVDINGDGVKEIIGISQASIEDSIDYREGTLLWAFEWEQQSGLFKVLDSIFMEDEFVFQGISSGDIVSNLPGNEIVFTIYGDDAQGSVKVIGWNNGLTSLYTSKDFLQDKEGFLTAPVVSDVDGDGINEIVLGITQTYPSNWEQTTENIDSMVDNPILYPLVQSEVIVIDNFVPSFHTIGNGAVYLISNANIDGDGYGDIVLSVSDIRVTYANQFFNGLWDFLGQFENDEKKSFLSSALHIFAPLIKELKGVLPISSSEVKGAKNGLNFDEITTRKEEEFTIPFPEIPEKILQTIVYHFENGSATQCYTYDDGISISQKTGDIDSDNLDEICIRLANIEIGVINSIITELNFAKITETSTSIRIDPYTGQPEWSDTNAFVDPRAIPHNLSSFPFSGKILFLDIKESQSWSYDLAPFHPWVSFQNEKIVGGESYIDISNLNTILSNLNNQWVEFRNFLPDSTGWFLPVIPSIPSPLIKGALQVFAKQGNTLNKPMDGFLSFLATSPEGVFTSAVTPAYTDINNYITQRNNDYTSHHNKWVKWAEGSIPPYKSAYDSCLAIHNVWAMEHYDSCQSSGPLPPEPQIDWPDWPEDEPYFEAPDYTGDFANMDLAFYDFNGTSVWDGCEKDSIAFSTQHGVVYDLDGDPSPDFIFLRYNIPTSDTQEFCINLYTYSTTPLSIELQDIVLPNVILQNIPNPFNKGTLIQYSISKNSHVVIDIYTISGQLVRRLVDEQKSPGSYVALWDGKNKKNKDVPSGVYLYKIKAGDYIATKKIVLIK